MSAGPSLVLSTTTNTLAAVGTAVKSAATVTDALAPFIPLIGNVTDIVREIVSLAQAAEHNKRICWTLYDRVKVAEGAVKELEVKARLYEDQLRNAQFLSNVKKLVNCMTRIKEFIKEVSQLSFFFKYFRANEVSDNFTALTQEFDGLMNTLNFALTVKINQDVQALAEDVKEFTKFMKHIHGGVTSVTPEGAKEINPQIETIHAMTTAWEKGRFLTDEDFLQSVMIDQGNLVPMDGEGNRTLKKMRYTGKGVGIEIVAVKPLLTKNQSDEKTRMTNQVAILKRLKDCEHIIKFYGCIDCDDGIHLVMQWAEYGSFKEYYNSGELITWQQKTQFALDIVRGLTFLHSVSILHRDLRSENVLITDQLSAKLANFVVSRTFSDDSRSIAPSLGMIRYTPPEKLDIKRKEKYGVKQEIYSFGMLLWEIVECKPPFHETTDFLEIKNIVCSPKQERPFHHDVPKKWREIVCKATEFSPQLRPSLSEIFNVLYNISVANKMALTPNASSTHVQQLSNANDYFIQTVSQDALPDTDDDDLCLGDDLSEVSLVLSVEQAIREHKKGNNRDKEAVYKAFETHAKYDDIIAKYWLGYYKYYNLLEVPEDSNAKHKRMEEAAQLFKTAADCNMADAQLRFGHCLWNGEGVRKDVREAIQYFEKSANNHNSTAQYNVGNVYLNGIIVAKDEEKGKRYLRLAAITNHEKAIKMCKDRNISLT